MKDRDIAIRIDNQFCWDSATPVLALANVLWRMVLVRQVVYLAEDQAPCLLEIAAIGDMFL